MPKYFNLYHGVRAAFAVLITFLYVVVSSLLILWIFNSSIHYIWLPFILLFLFVFSSVIFIGSITDRFQKILDRIWPEE